MFINEMLIDDFKNQYHIKANKCKFYLMYFQFLIFPSDIHSTACDNLLSLGCRFFAPSIHSRYSFLLVQLKF